MADETVVFVNRLKAVREAIKLLQDATPEVLPEVLYDALAEIEVLLGIVFSPESKPRRPRTVSEVNS